MKKRPQNRPLTFDNKLWSQCTKKQKKCHSTCSKWNRWNVVAAFFLQFAYILKSALNEIVKSLFHELCDEMAVDLDL